MKKVGFFIAALFCMMFMSAPAWGQTTLVTWTFPNNPDDATADGGIAANSTRTISTVGGTNTVAFSTAGATTRSASASNWASGSGTKYWLVSFTTSGYNTITLSSKQRSSSTGPRDFKVQYSLDNANWTDVTTVPALADNFTSGVLSNVSLPAATSNKTDVYIRWIMTSNTSVSNGTVGSVGVSNIDDIVVTGVANSISGQVTNQNGGLSGVTVNLSGDASASTTTNASGNYSFSTLPAGNYTITVSSTGPATGFSSSPSSIPVTLSTSNSTGNNFTLTALVIISEFRLDGPGGSTDEFIELYNTTSSSINVSGYTVASSDGVISLTVPSTTNIPGYGHYLITNSSGYSLSNYGGTGAAAGDQSYTSDVASNAGIALTNGLGGLLDSAGFTTTSPAAGFREGSGLTPATSSVDYSYARKFLTTGLPQDTNVNASDFWLLAVNPASVSGSTAVLGAPAPENLASPINRTSTMRSSLIDSGGSLGGANAFRDTNAYNYTGPSGSISFPAGTLDLRRQITNTTGGNVTKIRIRINNLSTLNSPGYSLGGAQADVRGINSPTVTVSTVNGSVTAQAIVLEEVPPTQTEGGGYNASWIVPLDTNTFPAGLPNNQSVIVNIRFGVKQGGQFKFAYTVEVLP